MERGVSQPRTPTRKKMRREFALFFQGPRRSLRQGREGWPTSHNNESRAESREAETPHTNDRTSSEREVFKTSWRTSGLEKLWKAHEQLSYICPEIQGESVLRVAVGDHYDTAYRGAGWTAERSLTRAQQRVP